jgi:hypothetical protein
MTTLASPPTRQAGRGVRLAGAWMLAGGLIGVAQAAILLAWPAQVSADRYSYPMTSRGFVLAQASFALQHIPLLIGVAALLWVPAVRASRTTRVGVVVTVVGLALLTAVELVAISAYDAGPHSSLGTVIDDSYGVPVLLMGIGLTAAGIASVRRRAGWTGATWLPAVVLALGVYVFVPLIPALGGSFVAARLGIGGWMLLYAALGYGLLRLRTDAGSSGAQH